MIESFVDLTYRGVSLGRRIRLTQIRPSSGYLELPAPMPVGTHLAIATEEGVVLDATVTWVHEQVAGADQTPGMLIAPMLAAEPAAAWWKERVALPDQERPRTRTTRNRPLTARPRTQTQTLETPPPATAPAMPEIISDLTARVTAAAGVAPPAPPEAAPAVPPAPSTVDEDAGQRTVVMRAIEPDDEPLITVTPGAPPEGEPRPTVTRAAEDGDRRTTVMNAVDQELLEQLSRPEGEAVLRGADDGPIVDDGKRTTIMDSIDPAALGFELAKATEPDAGDDEEASDLSGGDAEEPGDAADRAGGSEQPPPAGSRFKKRRRRR